MKKILLTLLLSIFLIPVVNADVVADIANRKFIPLTEVNDDNCSAYQGYYYYTDFDTFISNTNNKELFDKLYTKIKDYYIENKQQTRPYYKISVALLSKSSEKFDLYEVQIILHFNENAQNMPYVPLYITGNYDEISEVRTTGTPSVCNYPTSYAETSISGLSGNIKYFPLALFEGNHKVYLSNFGEGKVTVNLYDYFNNYIATYNSGDLLPYFIDGEYNNYLPKSYTEVNLDDYEYVILSLKDYNQKNPFETNLQVRGSIGITPVYEFGTTEKEVITDRCNASYSDFTDYRFFVLKNDIINNAVYYVKACEENSSFRFDNTIFDITYVTTDDLDDPVVTIGGKDYHTIPFDNLSNTVNKNEEEGFIPGENGSSLADIVSNATNFTSDIWNAISSFMGLVTKFFNTLPEEFRYLSITAFTVLVIIAIIKFIRG